MLKQLINLVNTNLITEFGDKFNWKKDKNFEDLQLKFLVGKISDFEWVNDGQIFFTHLGNFDKFFFFFFFAKSLFST